MEDDKLADQMSTVSELTSAKHAVDDMHKFYEKHKNRLPPTFKLYFNLIDVNHYSGSQGHFNFAEDKISSVLDIWSNMKEITELYIAVFASGKNDKLKNSIEKFIANLTNLIAAIESGMTPGKENAGATEVCMKRSKAMHNAAESLRNQNIVWKVGEMHIQDIKKLEERSIIKTDYSYITKENFMKNNYNPEELKNYQGEDDAVFGSDYTKLKENERGILDRVDKKLKER